MDYKTLNSVLKDLRKLRRTTKLASDVVRKIDENGEQGEEGLSYEIYPLPINGIFIKLTITTDSYGNDERVSGVEFVRPLQKTITNYETIND